MRNSKCAGKKFVSVPQTMHQVAMEALEQRTLLSVADIGIAGAVSGTVYNDLNGNGTHDSGEPGLTGRTVYADLNNNGSLDANEPFTTTDADGNYTLGGILDGALIVRQILGSGQRQSFPTGGTGQHVTVGSSPITGADFDATTKLYIAGSVFNDANGNGKQDSGENGLSGWTVYADLNNSGSFNASDPTTTTSASGKFAFVNLDAGAYIFRVLPPAGWTQTFPTKNFGQHITLASGDVDIDVPFGFAQNQTSGTISGIVFDDINQDGKLDNGEPGQDAWILYIDANNNGQLDSNEITTQADVNGHYTFSNLPAGNYLVRVFLGFSWTQTFPAKNFGQHITLSSGQSASDVDFGFARTYGAISGTVGISGSDEIPPIWTVYLDTNNNGKLDPGETFTTTVRGGFRFSPVTPGTYAVRVVIPPGWTQTVPDFGHAQIAAPVAGQELANVGFLLVHSITGTILGEVFQDTNGNGAFDSGEPGLAGWTVYLDLANSGVFQSGDPTAITSASGKYSFTNVAAGNYIVRAVPTAGWSQSYPSNNFGQHVSVLPAKTVYNVRFGETKIA